MSAAESPEPVSEALRQSTQIRVNYQEWARKYLMIADIEFTKFQYMPLLNGYTFDRNISGCKCLK